MFLPIDIESLSEEALLGVIDDFILREGTDYGPTEFDLQAKRERVLRDLKSGQTVVVFDAETETCTILPRDQLQTSKTTE